MIQRFRIESLFLWDPDNTTTYKISLGGKGKSIEDDSESESLGDETYDGYSSVAGCLLEGDDEKRGADDNSAWIYIKGRNKELGYMEM